MRGTPWVASLSWVLGACGGGAAPEVAHPLRVAPDATASAHAVTSGSAAPEPHAPPLADVPGACLTPAVTERLHGCGPTRARATGSAPGGRHKVGPVFTAAPPPPATNVAPASPAADACERQAALTRSVLARTSGNEAGVMAALEAQLDAYRQFAATSHDPVRTERCASETAGLVLETAIGWHLEAIGTGAVRGTAEPATMARAGTLYERVLASFEPAAFARLQFPRLAQGDWPTRAKISYARADLLYFAKDWERCGPAFDAVVTIDSTGPFAAEAAYASVLCHQAVYQLSRLDRATKGELLRDERRRTSADFAPRPLTAAAEGMLAAFGRYLCAVEPAPNDPAAVEAYAEVGFGRARSYFEAQHWEEAAIGFRDVALEGAGSEAGVFAAQLYLESLHVLATRVGPARPACLDAMRADLPPLMALYCEGAAGRDNGEACLVFRRVAEDLARTPRE
ncbi:MAG: hypothetical protein HY908_13580 [Myxococcales bacterium]|nr:hypothetical protein [Myxococcales bacterium]